MRASTADWVLMGFILHISGTLGKTRNICALRGSSVNLTCAAEHSANVSWYIVHRNGSTFPLKELSVDEKYPGTNITLTITDLRESDENVYCCKDMNNTELCEESSTEIHIADLQVKVLPSTEGQTVILMCSTSCPLTENPGYIVWFKNREFFYEDWSPWYQELVSGEEAARYSCAVKRYEDLRSPEVSVDSVTPNCFSVTYEKGKMCPGNLKSVDAPCSITYPRGIHVQFTSKRYDHVGLTCNTSCPEADPHTAFRWYWDRALMSSCESQNVASFQNFAQRFSCAVKGNEDLHSEEICRQTSCTSKANYVRDRVCALEGSSVDIITASPYEEHVMFNAVWFKAKLNFYKDYTAKGPWDSNFKLFVFSSLVENFDDKDYLYTLRINDLKRNDSGRYLFSFKKQSMMLIVTGLKVIMNPSAEVTEGQKVTLTCSTSCPLTMTTTYMWYFNGEPLNGPVNQKKHLILDPVDPQHAGNYSCAVRISNLLSSTEETLTVKAREKYVRILNGVKIALLLLMPAFLFKLYLMRNKQDASARLSVKDQTE
ncbi:uncharacterized protein ACNS7B_004677 [Menidia menidia]